MVIAPLKYGANGNAADIVRIAILIFAALSLNACARPVGDLGRAKPDVIHDQVLPTAGALRARIFGEPVSGFNWTDQEVDMHDRTWRFLIAPHTNDWFFDILVEWQRTRIAPRSNSHMLHNRYYELLRWQRFESSRVRYSRVSRDIDADISTIPSTFRSICAVLEVDQQRRIAADSLPSIGDAQYLDMQARRTENRVYIDWFVAALGYRYRSYTYALENLLVETPHEEARQLDARLSDYAAWVDRAGANDFCGDRQGTGADAGASGPKSRFTNKPFTPEPMYRK